MIMKVIAKKDLSDIHRRIDLINQAVISIANQLRVEIGHVTAEDIIESLEENQWHPNSPQNIGD